MAADHCVNSVCDPLLPAQKWRIEIGLNLLLQLLYHLTTTLSIKFHADLCPPDQG